MATAPPSPAGFLFLTNAKAYGELAGTFDFLSSPPDFTPPPDDMPPPPAEQWFKGWDEGLAKRDVGECQA